MHSHGSYSSIFDRLMFVTKKFAQTTFVIKINLLYRMHSHHFKHLQYKNEMEKSCYIKGTLVSLGKEQR